MKKKAPPIKSVVAPLDLIGGPADQGHLREGGSAAVLDCTGFQTRGR